MKERKPVDFAGESRVHVGFAVRDLKKSIAFYETLLGAPPVKVRPGYAKFEPAEPSVNLALRTSSVSAKQPPAHSGTHYGVQVKSTEAVERAEKRLREAGYATKVEQETACCYAIQDKVWARDPDGNEWEVFVVLDADSPVMRDAGTARANAESSGDAARPDGEAACCDDGCCSELEGESRREPAVTMSVSTNDKCC